MLKTQLSTEAHELDCKSEPIILLGQELSFSSKQWKYLLKKNPIYLLSFIVIN